MKKGRVEDTVDKLGPLIYTGESKLMPSPPLPIAERICAAHARDGFSFRHQHCKFIHERDVTKWPAATLTAWNAMVDNTPSLSWNPALVEAKVLGLKFTADNKLIAAVPPAQK